MNIEYQEKLKKYGAVTMDLPNILEDVPFEFLDKVRGLIYLVENQNDKYIQKACDEVRELASKICDANMGKGKK